ncbi:MAG: hypothetical protein V4550_04790 [Gemmatimonadota bacterium]
MKTRNFALCALGLAAAISLGSADSASAQASSQKKIPVRKDAPPVETAPPRVDTVFRVRVDTVTIRTRPDTIVRTVERMRYDTVKLALPIQPLPGLYFALGGGVAVPMNNWRNSTKDGPAISGQVGWFPKDGALGIRAEALGNFFGHRTTDCAGCPSPRLYEGNADLVLRFPIERTSKLNPVFYLLGGGGLDKFQNFIPYKNGQNNVITAGTNTFIGTGSQNPYNVSVATRGETSTFYNYNAGLGLAFTLMDTHLFVESKYTTINTNGGGASHYWPIIAGLQFYK